MNTFTQSTRTITNADIWAATKGLGLFRMEKDEVIALGAQHESNPMFASQVIAEACRQVATVKEMGVR